MNLISYCGDRRKKMLKVSFALAYVLNRLSTSMSISCFECFSPVGIGALLTCMLGVVSMRFSIYCMLGSGTRYVFYIFMYVSVWDAQFFFKFIFMNSTSVRNNYVPVAVAVIP
ncbi:hypothetical protein RIF29_05811 [Crotalaria pallida]|uniref:Uncharacterized protein n=1 Tax=Crotalaria pallida TaxID=3830 RepID=A0AAN9PB49_CROPI